MTIEIHQPELEALILERMRHGQSAEEIVIQAFFGPPPSLPTGFATGDPCAVWLGVMASF